MKRISDQDFDRLQDIYNFNPSVCPTCNGAEIYTLHGEEYICVCRSQIALSKLYLHANIGRRFHTLSLEDFCSPDSARVEPLVTNYLDNFEANRFHGLGFVFWGGIGTGKTLIACHILKEVVKRGYSGYFVQFDELIDTWGKRWADDDQCRLLDDRLKRSDLTVIDDLATDKRNIEGFLSSGLEHVVRFRYNHSLPTVVTTNLSENQQQAEFPRVFSLLAATNDWVRMESKKDYRMDEQLEHIRDLSKRGECLPVV